MGPWLGSLGAFCGKWGNDDFVEGEWCFVLPNQLCEPNARSRGLFVVTSAGSKLDSACVCMQLRILVVLRGREECLTCFRDDDLVQEMMFAEFAA